MLPDELEALLRDAGDGPVVFDADGTLWRGDVGDELVRELGHFEEYERRVHADPIAGYTWAAELLVGREPRDLAGRCERLFAQQQVFAFVLPLLERLSGRDVYVVSASPREAVLPGSRRLGIPDGRVIAVGPERPIPCGQGKVHHLKLRNLRPALAFGNGDLDEPMLSYAKRAVVVAPVSGPENQLVAAAKRNGWPILRA